MSKINNAFNFMFGTPIGAYLTGLALSTLAFYSVDRLDRWYKNKSLAMYEKGFNDAKSYFDVGLAKFDIERVSGLDTLIVKPILPLKTEVDTEVETKIEDDDTPCDDE